MEDRCICCGEIVPEGRQICPTCSKQSRHNPCFQCEDRKIGCHSKCERYIKWCNINKALKCEIVEGRKKYREQEDLLIRRSNRMRREKRR